MFSFVDRLGNRTSLMSRKDDTVAEVLLRHHIPPASVLVLNHSVPIPDNHILTDSGDYVAYLIEGYDIDFIRNIYNQVGHESEVDAIYSKARLSLTNQGGLFLENNGLSANEVVEHVERTIIDTCNLYDLIPPHSSIVIGLSGGVDSSSLLMGLVSSMPHLPTFRMVAATFEDFDSQFSPTFQHANALADEYGVEYRVLPATMAEEVFHLNTPLRVVLQKLMQTDSAHHVMYIDHHTTRRVLEVFAQREKIDRIGLGLHTTDIIAGLLNQWLTGYNVAELPKRNIGTATYIYPLAFVPKRELHLYHWVRTNQFARHSQPNLWELNPKDRNFYYYVADRLQEIWPGLEYMLFTAHNYRLRRQDALTYHVCENCGASILHQPFTTVDGTECDVCATLRKNGFIG